VGELPDARGGQARLTLGVFQRVRLDLRPVGVEAAGRAVDEGAILQPRRDDLAPDRVRERDVAPDVEPQPRIGPGGAGRPARVDRVEAGATPDAAQEVVEEDRVGLARVRAPEDDEVRLLDLPV
jgi:hypothetical protein